MTESRNADSELEKKLWQAADKLRSNMDAADHKFVFPDFVLNAGKTVKVYTGKGTASSTSLYWGSSSAIWNNHKDTTYLYDNNGKLIDTYKYER